MQVKYKLQLFCLCSILHLSWMLVQDRCKEAHFLLLIPLYNLKNCIHWVPIGGKCWICSRFIFNKFLNFNQVWSNNCRLTWLKRTSLLVVLNQLGYYTGGWNMCYFRQPSGTLNSVIVENFALIHLPGLYKEHFGRGLVLQKHFVRAEINSCLYWGAVFGGWIFRFCLKGRENCFGLE